MSYYDVLVFLHVAAAIIWLGTGFAVLALVFRLQRVGDRTGVKSIADNSQWLAQRVFIPSSLAVLLLGILLTIEGPWSFGDLWIVLGLAGYAASFFTGILFLKPEGERIARALDEHGPNSPQAWARIHRIDVVQRVEMVILFLVVAVMALKPSGEDVGALVLLAAIALAALAAGARSMRSAHAAAPARDPV